VRSTDWFDPATNILLVNVSTLQPLVTDLSATNVSSVVLYGVGGECGQERMYSDGGAHVDGAIIGAVNVPLFVKHHIRYRIQARGEFYCDSQAGFDAFLAHFASPLFEGVSFDGNQESSKWQPNMTHLAQRVVEARVKHPQLTFTFALPVGAKSPDGVHVATPFSSTSPGPGPYDYPPRDGGIVAAGAEGFAAVCAVFNFTVGKSSGSDWPSNAHVELAADRYDIWPPNSPPTSSQCVVAADGQTCQMAESMVQAAFNFHNWTGIPYSSIEMTVLIGEASPPEQIFSHADATTLAAHAVRSGIAAIHWFAYGDDRPCTSGAKNWGCTDLDTQPYEYLQHFVAGIQPAEAHNHVRITL